MCGNRSRKDRALSLLPLHSPHRKGSVSTHALTNVFTAYQVPSGERAKEKVNIRHAALLRKDAEPGRRLGDAEVGPPSEKGLEKMEGVGKETDMLPCVWWVFSSLPASLTFHHKEEK